MLDLASEAAGGSVLMVSSLDAAHPAGNVIDGSKESYWISTGLYPQEILLKLGCRCPVLGVQLTSTSVRQVRIEGSQDASPVNFQMLAETSLADSGEMQQQALQCQKQGRTGYLRVVILSGWHDFCSVHEIRVEASQADVEALPPEPAKAAKEAPTPTEAQSQRQLESCSIRVTSPGGKSHAAVVAEPFWVAQDVKSAVEEALGIPRQEMRLLLGSTEVPDERAMATLAAAAKEGLDLTAVRRDPRQAQWIEQVQKDGLSLRFAQNFVADRQVALAAVKQTGDALQFASDGLRADREIALAAVQKKGSAIQWALPELRQDHEIGLAAVRQSGNALQFCGKELRADRTVVLAAVSKHGSALRWASRDLRDKEVVDLASRTYFWTKRELANLQEEEEESEGSAGSEEDGN